MPMQYMQLLGIIHVFTQLISWCRRFADLSVAIEFACRSKRRHLHGICLRNGDSSPVASHPIRMDRNFGFQEQRSESVFQMQEEGLVDHRHL